MSPYRLCTVLVFVAYTASVRSQYFDFIQGLQALIQPYQAPNQYYGQTTKRPQTKSSQRRPVYDSSLFIFQDDTTKRPRTTTIRPRKTTRKNTNTAGKSGSQNFEATTQLIQRYNTSIKRIQNDNPSSITFLDDQEKRIVTNLDQNKNRNDNTKKVVNNNFSRPQKIINTDFNNKPQKQVSSNQNQGINNYEITTQKNLIYTTKKHTTQYDTHSNLNSYTTQRPAHNNQDYNSNNQNYNANNQGYNNKNDNYNLNNQNYNTNNQAYNNRNENYNSNNQNYNANNQNYNNKNQNTKPMYTTRNPLANHVGVRPANVDENQPPITNSPVTDSFYNLPGSESGEDDLEPPIEIGPNEENMTPSEKRRYLEVAEEVCNEYKARLVKKVFALPLASSPVGPAVNVTNCTPLNVRLIIGGVVSTIQEFPHMALVGWRLILRNGYSWKCGASLISDQFLLTAGHCTFQDKDNNAVSGTPHAVQLGSDVMDGPKATVVQIASVIRHPKYKRRRVYHDVAMIKLVQRVSFSETIRPACLGRAPGVDQHIIATGWGRTEYGGAQSQELRSVSLPIWNMGECKEVWGTSRKLPNGPMIDDQVCAGEKNGGKDTCQGDSGGPAQIQDGCTWRVVAVTSYGRSCGAPLTPALYARIPIIFVAAKAFADRLNSQTHPINNNQQNYGTTEGYDGYQNDGNRYNYEQPNYDNNRRDYDKNQQNYNNNQQSFNRNTPNYTNNQQNYAYNQPKQTNYQNYETPVNYNNQNVGVNQPNYNNQQNYNRNPPNYNNQENFYRYQPDYNRQNYEPSTYVNNQNGPTDYNRNPSNYDRNQHNYEQPSYETPNYGYNQRNYEQNYRIPEATRPWWSSI